jgi:EAL domain-containing protein (putative c-di-GMP-specific phosphodiesterase class I)
VLRTACEHAISREGEPGHIAVNLSAAQLHRVDVVDMVRDVLAATGLPARNLELEITESAIMQDRNVAAHTLAELKQLGVRLAIDDFGTGYSSLSYIRDLPVDTVKIDRHFLTDVPHTNARATELYRSIVEMARRLGLYVVSEGVETPAQRDFVRDTGCDAIQGFLLSPALAPILVWHFDVNMRSRAQVAAAG